jgi:predicted aspartyl protease
MGNYIHKINVSLEGRQVDHQSIVVEIEGKIQNKQVSILIDPGESLSYITPSLVESCKLKKVKHNKSWLVQLATGTKRKVSEYISNCDIGINDQNTLVNLNVLPLGSYDILIGMDWLESHKVLLNCYEKSFVYQDENKVKRTVQGLRKPDLGKTVISHAA